MPAVRVIIPTYNRALLLEEALESVFSQTYCDLEVIVVDDGSTDATPQVLHKAAQRDSRVRHLRADRLGPAAARNMAIAQPGPFQYVAFLDSDDVWMPHHLSIAVGALKEMSAASAVFGRVRTVDRSGVWTAERLAEREARSVRPRQYSVRHNGHVHLLDRRRFSSAMLRGELQPHPSAFVIRAAAAGGRWFDTSFRILEDTQFFLRMSLAAPFAFIDDVHATVQYHGDNLSGSADLSRPESLVRCTCLLAFARWKQPLCETAGDRLVTRRHIADAAYLLGQCWADRFNRTAARKAYLESLLAMPSRRAFRGLAGALLPTPLSRRVHQLRSGSR
jgi:glycosyltransferase involved in cell wall biosynthesis